MILPKNGRVVIIDDMPDQALPLIKAMSKYNISTTYFNGQIENLPVELSSDTRIIFLDINLNGEQQPHWKNEKGTIFSTITSIIEKNTPYILFVWSLNEKTQEDEEDESTLFEKIIELFKNDLIEYSPLIAPIPLGKDEIFKQEILGDGENAKIIYSLNFTEIETIEFIKQKIENGIKDIDSIEALLKWEGIVDKAASKTINEIIQLAKNEGELNLKLKSIFFKLAEAQWGKQIKIEDGEDLTKKAISMLNNVLNDKIENEISASKFSLIKKYDYPEEFSELNKAMLNSQMLLNKDNRLLTLPGNVYQCVQEEIDAPPIKSIIADIIDMPYIVEEFYLEKENVEDIPQNFEHSKYKNENKSSYAKFEKKIRNLLKEKSIFINVELSPACDFAQRKWRLNRVCPGILLESECNYYIGNADSIYQSPEIFYNNKIYNLIIDFRYFSSCLPEILKDKTPIFSLRHSFLVDIQSILGRHINRPGISSVN